MPWLSIITAPCVWAIIVVHTGSVFGYFLVVNQLPGYMKTILKYDIKSNGLFSSLPYFGKYAMSVTASYLADHLRKTGRMSTVVARKVCLEKKPLIDAQIDAKCYFRRVSPHLPSPPPV